MMAISPRLLWKIGIPPSFSLSLTCLILTNSTEGAGFFIPTQSTAASGRGNAWVATADSPAAVHYNPAGLTQIDDRSLELGLYTIHLGNRTDIGGNKFEAKKEYQPVPSFFYAQPLSDDLTLGFGIYSPFGLGTEWGNETSFRQVTTKADLINLRASVVAGYRVSDTFSIGGGLSLNYANAVLEQGLTPFNATAPTNDFLEFDGDDISLSWIIGAHWQPHEQHSFGIVYRSQADYDLSGSVSGTDGFGVPFGSASLEILTPESAAIGYASRPTKRLTIEANIEWINWDEFNSLTISTPVANLPTQRFDWESTFIYEIGFSYQLNDRYTVSFGYDYNENAQPDTFYSPAVADGNRHWLNAGLTYHGDHMTWDFGYQYGFSTTDVTSSLLGTNGRYEADHHAVLISTRFSF